MVGTDAQQRAKSGEVPRWSLLLLALFVVLPGLFMGLHADDWFQVQPRTIGKVLQTFAGDWNSGQQGGGGFYRPLARLSFWIDYQLYGLAAWGYHLTNGLLFLGIVAVLGKMAHLLGGGSALSTLVACTILLLSPLKNEALYWVSGRTDLLVGFVTLATLLGGLLSLSRNDMRLSVITLLGVFATLACKENGLSVCLLLPLAVLILRPQGRWTPCQWLLLLVPPFLGFVYFFLRNHLLGGLAGYTTGGGYRSVGSIATGAGAMLSALFFPWVSSAASAYIPLRAIPGFGLLLVWMVWRNTPRSVWFALISMGCCILPFIHVSIGPSDGARLLMLPLCFQALLIGLLVRGIVSSILVALLIVSLQPINLGETLRFVGVARENRLYIQKAVDAVIDAPDGAIIIAPEIQRRYSMRILDPGAALDQAVMAHWMHRHGGTLVTDLVQEAPYDRLALRLSAPDRSVIVSYQLQPWMDGHIRYLDTRLPSLLYCHQLERLSVSTMTSSDGVELRSGQPIPIPLEGAQRYDFVSVEAISDQPASGVSVLEVRSEDQRISPVASKGVFFPIRGHWLSHVVSALDFELPARAVYHVAEGAVPFRLRTVRYAIYRIVESDSLLIQSDRMLRKLKLEEETPNP